MNALIGKTTLDILEGIQEFKSEMYERIMRLPFATRNADLPNKRGIYILISEGQIVYIGQSWNIKKRWMARKDFIASDSYQVHYLLDDPFGTFNLDAMEGLLTFLFVPAYNHAIRNKVDSKAWKMFPREEA